MGMSYIYVCTAFPPHYCCPEAQHLALLGLLQELVAVIKTAIFKHLYGQSIHASVLYLFLALCSSPPLSHDSEAFLSEEKENYAHHCHKSSPYGNIYMIICTMTMVALTMASRHGLKHS
jgi:hypothetical protein